MQDAVQNREVLVGRDDIDMIGLDLHPVGDLTDCHGRPSLQKFHHDALVGRIQVLNHHKAKAGILRDMSKKLLQGFQTSRRCADSHNGKERLELTASMGGRADAVLPTAAARWCFRPPFGVLFIMAQSHRPAALISFRSRVYQLGWRFAIPFTGRFLLPVGVLRVLAAGTAGRNLRADRGALVRERTQCRICRRSSPPALVSPAGRGVCAGWRIRPG